MLLAFVWWKSAVFVPPSPLQAICVGPENLQVMYPAIFEQLLLFVEFSCKPPQYGRMETKHVANAKYNQVGSGTGSAISSAVDLFTWEHVFILFVQLHFFILMKETPSPPTFSFVQFESALLIISCTKLVSPQDPSHLHQFIGSIPVEFSTLCI